MFCSKSKCQNCSALWSVAPFLVMHYEWINTPYFQIIQIVLLFNLCLCAPICSSNNFIQFGFIHTISSNFLNSNLLNTKSIRKDELYQWRLWIHKWMNTGEGLIYIYGKKEKKQANKKQKSVDLTESNWKSTWQYFFHQQSSFLYTLKHLKMFLQKKNKTKKCKKNLICAVVRERAFIDHRC